MLDSAIEGFFSDRRAGWLKARVKANMPLEEQAKLECEAEEKFALANWLPDAAKRAGQLSMVSHPGKFGHPSAKISSFVAQAERLNDGLLRTGNAKGGNLIPDAYYAALAIETGSEWVTTDRDFSRFPDLRWSLSV